MRSVLRPATGLGSDYNAVFREVDMRYREFGSTGWRLSAIGYGGVPLSFGSRPDEGSAIAVVLRAIESGVNLFDTADAYCRDDTEIGHNERLIAKALERLSPSDRADVKVFTKGGYIRPGGGWEPDGRPEHLRAACEGSLRALGVERIDLYQHHRPDPDVPVADSVGELSRLCDEGKIEHIGVSNYSVGQLDEVNEIAPVQSVQNQYSPRCREPESDGTLGATGERSQAFIPWAPLGGIVGASKLSEGLETLTEVGESHGCGPHRVALAWLLAKGDHVFPIPGSSRLETLEDSVAAADLDLEPEEVARLDREL